MGSSIEEPAASSDFCATGWRPCALREAEGSLLSAHLLCVCGKGQAKGAHISPELQEQPWPSVGSQPGTSLQTQSLLSDQEAGTPGGKTLVCHQNLYVTSCSQRDLCHATRVACIREDEADVSGTRAPQAQKEVR